MIPQLIGAGIGLVSGFLQDNALKRKEDEITKKARQKHEASLEAINSFNPQAAARQADIGLAMQQDAATSNALNAATAGQANSGMGGNVQAPNAAAVGNSSAAISASGQFAGARSQNAMSAAQMTQQKNSQLDQNAAAYGQLAKDVNLIHEDKGIGGMIMNGLAGLGSGLGVMGQAAKILGSDEQKISTDNTKVPLPDTTGIEQYNIGDPQTPVDFTDTSHLNQVAPFDNSGTPSLNMNFNQPETPMDFSNPNLGTPRTLEEMQAGQLANEQIGQSVTDAQQLLNTGLMQGQPDPANQFAMAKYAKQRATGKNFGSLLNFGQGLKGLLGY